MSVGRKALHFFKFLKMTARIQTYIVKVASRCNLNCSYCYMYNMGDTTFVKQPKFMSINTYMAFVDKLANHCEKEKLPYIYIAFHGGEPLLATKEFYTTAVTYTKRVIKDTEVIFTLQSNGTLVDDAWCHFLKELDVQIGISIDGPEQYHNLYRLYHNNKASFNEVVNGIKIRDKYWQGGIIMVANRNIPPNELYSFFKEINTPSVNILLPDLNYANYQKFYNKHDGNLSYGDWLIELYKLWKADSEKPKISMFNNIVEMILGSIKGDEMMGAVKSGAVCIESDGAIEIVDPLRICGNGFTRNSLNVYTNEIEDIASIQVFNLYYHSHDLLCDKCLNCQIVNVCGGGYFGHRFSYENGFDNPSIYCDDLRKIITFIQNDIFDSLPEMIAQQLELSKFTYEDIKAMDDPQNDRLGKYSNLLNNYFQNHPILL